ncbi:MAG: hypothetical protein ACKO8L_10180 [Flavobacterium sp.]
MKVNTEYRLFITGKEFFDVEYKNKQEGKPSGLDFYNITVLHNPNKEFKLASGESAIYATEKEMVSYMTYEFGRAVEKKKSITNEYILIKK